MQQKQSCDVKGCKETHSKHFCRLCDNENSDHFSSKCPLGKILYHGTNITAVGPINEDGLRISQNGRIGAGIYFVENQSEAKSISEYRAAQKNQPVDLCTVFKCKVNLGKQINLGFKSESNWHNLFDSAKSIHPPWAGINKDFHEHCLKNPKKCAVVSITIKDKEIGKDEYEAWRKAQPLFAKLQPHASNSVLNQAVHQINQLKQDKAIVYKKIVKAWNTFQEFKCPNIKCLEITKELRQFVLWLVSNPCFTIKLIFILLGMANGIASLSHLFSISNSAMHSSLISFAVFFTLLSLARFVYLILNVAVETEEIHMLVAYKLLMTFVFEMPMLVSQSYAFTKVDKLMWVDFIWDVSLEFQFHLNIFIFLTLDFIVFWAENYTNDCKMCCKLFWSTIGTPLILLITSSIMFAPIYLTQVGFVMIPSLNKFGGTIPDQGSVVNLLNFIMYMGAIGLWIWCGFLLILCWAFFIYCTCKCICS